jgi:hypothetical protein
MPRSKTKIARSGGTILHLPRSLRDAGIAAAIVMQGSLVLHQCWETVVEEVWVDPSRPGVQNMYLGYDKIVAHPHDHRLQSDHILLSLILSLNCREDIAAGGLPETIMPFQKPRQNGLKD